MRRQERSSAKHSRLHFVGNQKCSVALAQRLHIFQIIWRRNPNAAFRLDGFDKKGGVTLSRQFLLKDGKIAEWHACSIGKKRSETFAPVLAIHQGQCAASQAVKSAVAGK